MNHIYTPSALPGHSTCQRKLARVTRPENGPAVTEYVTVFRARNNRAARKAAAGSAVNVERGLIVMVAVVTAS